MSDYVAVLKCYSPATGNVVASVFVDPAGFVSIEGDETLAIIRMGNLANKLNELRGRIANGQPPEGIVAAPVPPKRRGRICRSCQLRNPPGTACCTGCGADLPRPGPQPRALA